MLRLLDRDQRAFQGKYLAVVGSSIDVFVYASRLPHRRGEFPLNPNALPESSVRLCVVRNVQCDRIYLARNGNMRSNLVTVVNIKNLKTVLLPSLHGK